MASASSDWRAALVLPAELQVNALVQGLQEANANISQAEYTAADVGIFLTKHKDFFSKLVPEQQQQAQGGQGVDQHWKSFTSAVSNYATTTFDLQAVAADEITKLTEQAARQDAEMKRMQVEYENFERQMLMDPNEAANLHHEQTQKTAVKDALQGFSTAISQVVLESMRSQLAHERTMSALAQRLMAVENLQNILLLQYEKEMKELRDLITQNNNNNNKVEETDQDDDDDGDAADSDLESERSKAKSKSKQQQQQQQHHRPSAGAARKKANISGGGGGSGSSNNNKVISQPFVGRELPRGPPTSTTAAKKSILSPIKFLKPLDPNDRTLQPIPEKYDIDGDLDDFAALKAGENMQFGGEDGLDSLPPLYASPALLPNWVNNFAKRIMWRRIMHNIYPSLERLLQRDFTPQQVVAFNTKGVALMVAKATRPTFVNVDLDDEVTHGFTGKRITPAERIQLQELQEMLTKLATKLEASGNFVKFFDYITKNYRGFERHTIPY
jgi:hypothetical protein